MTVLQSRPPCNANRPAAAAALSPCAVRLRTPCGRSGSRARLSDRELSARRVVRERAVVRQRMRPYEVRSLALGAEAKIFKLHHRYDRIIVISLDEIDILRREGGHRPQFTDIELPAAAYLHWIVRKGVVPLDCR